VQEAGLADKSGQVAGSDAASTAAADAKSKAEKPGSAGSENSVQNKTETKGIPSQEAAIPVEGTVRNPVRSAPEKSDTKAIDLATAKPDGVAFSPVPPAASLAAQTAISLAAGDFLRAETVPETRPTMIHAVPMEIGFRALQGQKRFDIRLDPGDLGRVDVRLDISDDGSVKALLTVDRVETLHLLQRDARSLEQAFEQAGLKSSDSSVDIQLRDRNLDPGQSHNRPQQDDAPQKVIRTAIVDEDAPLALHPSLARIGHVSTRGVDIVI
jgi:flagellar hook-length control protein FliK